MTIAPFSTFHLDYLLRSKVQIDSLSATMPCTSARPAFRRLWQVHGVGRLHKSPEVAHEPLVHLPGKDLLTGMYGHKFRLVLLLSGSPDGVSVYLGTWADANRENVTARDLDYRSGVVKSLLDSLFPAIELTQIEVELKRFPRAGLVLGIPTAKPPDSADGALQMDRLIRALLGVDWACLVLAEPAKETVASDLRNDVLNEIRSVQSTAQSERVPSPLAEHYSELLTVALKSLGSGLEVGFWRTAVYLLGDAKSYLSLAGLWRGIFSGDESLPEPVRVWDSPEVSNLADTWALPDTPGARGPGKYHYPVEYQTLLTSNQLAAYIQLPQMETSGFRISTVPDFDAEPPPADSDRVIQLGTVSLRTRKTKSAYRIALDDLTRHAFIAGMTGSGKTNSIFHLVKEADKAKVSFLVLEPAKTEYRALIEDARLRDRIQVFTLGDEITSPFRLNPFEVVSSKIPIGFHIDLLRSVFNASFGMWTPLPQILEQALQSIYSDRGWNTIANKNHRLDNRGSSVTDAYPTLTELRAKVEDILKNRGYEADITDNMRAALVTRIDGLRAGAKGRMLDVQRSLPFEELVEKPTVLEMQDVGDDDDKAFLMGLILTRLYEYRRAGEESKTLKHLIVIEEAHRLLTIAGARSSEGEADPRAKAVETFANVLSEIRAYGQGVIVVDQIPSKLAPEIIKNTNFKIAHTLVDADDRTVMAGAMNMTEPQAGALAMLTRGQAAVFRAGDDTPVLVEVEKSKGDSSLDRAAVQSYMSSSQIVRSNEALFNPILPGVDMSKPAVYMARDAARDLADDATFKKTFLRFVVSITEEDSALDRLWNDLVVQAHGSFQNGMDEAVLLRALMIYAAQSFTQRRASQSSWSYEDTGELGKKLEAVLLSALEGKDARPALTTFRALMHRLCERQFEPFVRCERICTQSSPLCLYRHVVADLINGSREELQARWNEALMDDSDSDGREKLWAASKPALMLIENHPQQQEGIRRIRLCYAQHMLSSNFLERHKQILEGLLTAAKGLQQ